MNSKPIGLWITDLHLHLNNVELFERTIDRVVKLGKENGIRYIFNGGDTFTSRKGQPQEVLKVLYKSLEKIRKAKMVMYTIVGNHDKTDYKSKDSFLIPFQDHKAMKLVEAYESVEVSEGLYVHMVSFFEDEMYLEQLGLCKTEIMEGCINICMTHIGIDGAKMNSGISLSSSVNAGHYNEFNAVYVGHYHNKQQLNDRISYTGSTYPHNFGEDNDKGIYFLMDNGALMQIEDKDHFAPYITHELQDVTDEDVDRVLAGDPIGAINQRVKCTNISPMLRARLTSQGVKVVVEKQDLIMSVEKSTVEQYDTKGIMEEYDQWASKRGITEPEYGKKLLSDVL